MVDEEKPQVPDEGRAVGEDYEPSPYPLTAILKNPTADDIVKWVRNNFELPEETDAIWDSEDDKYVYMLGGNYELRDILQDHFDDVDEEILEKAQNVLSGEGWEWVRKGLY